MFFPSLKIFSLLDAAYKALCELIFAYLSNFPICTESLLSYLWHFAHAVSSA